MGASGWEYYVPYQADLDAALDALRATVFAEGAYWWAVPYELGKSAADFPNRPRTEDELWAADDVKESGTHSILDVFRVADPGEAATYGLVMPVTADEAAPITGGAELTRDHVGALEPLTADRGVGRCAVLHDAAGTPTEIYFWGASGD
jgi:hypothetical protein